MFFCRIMTPQKTDRIPPGLSSCHNYNIMATAQTEVVLAPQRTVVLGVLRNLRAGGVIMVLLPRRAR
jgi:hypothetical protein